MNNQVFVPLIAFPAESNLLKLTKHWQSLNVPHRIVEQNSQQVVYAPQHLRDRLALDAQAFNAGTLELDLSEPSADPVSPDFVDVFKSAPVTLTLILVSVIGFFAGTYQLQPLYDLMVMQSIDDSGVAEFLGLSPRISIDEFLSHGQYWRLVTPIFLHFGWLHIVFNMLWLWELGRRIERAVGSMHLLMITFFIGIASNLWQAASTPLSGFGGMSGVVYGLLAYCGVFSLILRDQRFELPLPIYVLMLASLALGYSGLLDSFVMMANTAHLMGLVYGIVIAIPSALIFKVTR